MTNRSLFLLFLLFAGIIASSQTIGRQEADSMLRALKKTKQDTDRIGLLLGIAQFHIFKPGEQAIDFDSAKAYINQAATLNKSLKSTAAEGYQLLTESYLTKEKGQKDEGRKMAEEAVNILKRGDNKYYLARAYYELSMYYGYEKPQERMERIELVEKAVETFRQAGKLERNAYSLEMLGDLYGLIDEYSKSTEVLNEALIAYQSINNPRVQGIYVLIGENYQFMGNESQSLFYLLKALKTAQEVGDTSMQLCQINNLIGTLYSRIDRNEMSVKYLNDALVTAKKYNDEDALFLLTTNIAPIYNKLHQPEKALYALSLIPNSIQTNKVPLDRGWIAMAYSRSYMELQQYDKAKPYCDTLLWLSDNKMTGNNTRNSMYRLAATYFIETKQYAKARDCLMKNVEIQKDQGYAYASILDSRLWYKIDSAQGNFKSAFNYLLHYKTKMDSMFSANREKQLQVLGVEYEIALKEDSIKSKNKDIDHLTKTNILTKANFQQASLIKNITIAGIVLTVIILILLYRQYRHKQKNNELITQKNEQLQHYLNEKEWLLKEIHHRVKNNLQIVMSLLNSQSAYIDNGPALTAIHDSQHRVHAMSLIHQKLYNTENLSSIDMSFYIRELVSYLADSFSTGQRIRFEFDIEPIEMDVSQAVPLGLILNEAITNSIKYAFPGNRDGLISISLSENAAHQCSLIIADNGAGMPVHLNNKKPGSLGISLMAGLSEDLDGSFSIENNNGTTIKISFVHDPGVKRHDALTTSLISHN